MATRQDEIRAYDAFWTNELREGPIWKRLHRDPASPRDVRVWTKHAPIRCDDDARAVIRAEVAAHLPSGIDCLRDIHAACISGVALPVDFNDGTTGPVSAMQIVSHAGCAARAAQRAWSRIDAKTHPKTRLIFASIWIGQLACLEFDPGQLLPRATYALQRRVFADMLYELRVYLLPCAAPALPQSKHLASAEYKCA